jgi:hypothetical protein
MASAGWRGDAGLGAPGRHRLGRRLEDNMSLRIPALVTALTGAALVATPLHATNFADPHGDLLATYTGPPDGDLDILSGSAEFTSDDLLLSSTMNGPIGTTAGSLFLWGVDRGSGTDRLITSGPPAVGTPDMLLDAIVALLANGTGRVVTFPTMGAPVTTPLDPSLITISGDTISARIPRGLLPTTGFAFEDYTYVHWSRSVVGGQQFIADLAPDASSFTASYAPEPAIWGLAVFGFGLTGAAFRRRRRATFGLISGLRVS